MSPAAARPEFVAKHRFARITARKARKVADLIRGRGVNEALELLEFAPQRGSAFYLKVVKSASLGDAADWEDEGERGDPSLAKEI